MSSIDLSKYSFLREKYNDPGTEYCFKVLNGEILTGELIQLACLRQLNDLIRSENNQDNFPYYYSIDSVQGILRFAEIVPDVTTGKVFELAQFQKFIFAMQQGWWHKKTNALRFRRSMISMARTNSKTQIASDLATYNFLLGQPEFSREIVVSSNTASQIEQLYNYISLSLEKLLSGYYFGAWKDQIVINSERAYMPASKNRLFKLSADSKRGGDSSHPTLAIYDEYHQQATTDFIDSLTSGNVQNDLSLIHI